MMTQSLVDERHVQQMQEGQALSPTPSLQQAEGGLVCFKGKGDVLSNFFPSKFRHSGMMVNCVEQAYQYEKAMMYGCYDVASGIMKEQSAFKMWLMAKQIQVDDRWLKSRVRIMRGILQSRLAQDATYRQKLLCCDGIIVEAVRGDVFWSSGLDGVDVVATPQAEWPGENVMGRLHMEMRHTLRNDSENMPANAPASTSAARTPAVRNPAASTLTARTPAARTPAARNPAARTPATQVLRQLKRCQESDDDFVIPAKMNKPPTSSVNASSVPTSSGSASSVLTNTTVTPAREPAGTCGKCIWCTQVKELVPGKRFCQRCGANGKECAHCHRPMPERFFQMSDRLCNSCCRKYTKQKEKRRLARKAARTARCATNTVSFV